jgi:hypothetical protein
MDGRPGRGPGPRPGVRTTDRGRPGRDGRRWWLTQLTVAGQEEGGVDEGEVRVFFHPVLRQGGNGGPPGGASHGRPWGFAQLTQAAPARATEAWRRVGVRTTDGGCPG